MSILRAFGLAGFATGGRNTAGDKRLANIFHEVDEEVRRERMRQFWERYSLLIVIVVVLVVGGVAGWRGYEYLQNQRAAETGAQFEAAARLAESGNLADAEKEFARIAESGTAGYRLLARLRTAEVTAPRDRAAAVTAFDAIAADSSVNAIYRDLAALRAGYLLVDSATFADMQQRLEPLTGTQRTFRHSARELLALSAFRSKDYDAMRRWAQVITEDAESPAGLRSRIEAMIALVNTAKG
jgi:hypothetical protein